tara:strand:+ start:1376 stop:1579 length:204 start_codon:yes stop_codon:yes gene_type:complete
MKVRNTENGFQIQFDDNDFDKGSEEVLNEIDKQVDFEKIQNEIGFSKDKEQRLFEIAKTMKPGKENK